MALSVKFATPALVPFGDGGIRVKFDDGSEMEFASATAMQESCLNGLPSADDLKAMAIIQRLGVDPLMDSPALWDGKTVTLDVEKETPSQVFAVA